MTLLTFEELISVLEKLQGAGGQDMLLNIFI